MFEIRKMNKKLDKLIKELYKIDNKEHIIKRNFIAGLSRGVGIGIGVTIITALLIFILEKIVKLNIPIIGKYIAEIVEVVTNEKY